MAQSVEEKQTYLRENILEKGYDGEEFMHFCKEKCGDIDLEKWSMDFLKKIVKSYLSSNPSEKSKEQDEEMWSEFQSQTEKQTQNPMFSQADWAVFLGNSDPLNQQTTEKQKPKIQKAMSPPTNPKIQEEKSEKVEVKNQEKLEEKKSPQINIQVQSQSTKIKSQGNIVMRTLKAKQMPALPPITDISILKTEQKTRNFLQGDYTLYHIKFSPCNHIIQRKFNDFRKLRGVLQKLYPHIRLPYLQPEGWLVNSSEAKDQQTLSKYKYMIVEFLKYIMMRNETLKKSKIVRIFVGMLEGTPTDFKKYENIQKPKKISQLCLPEGQLNFSDFQSLIPIDKYMTNTQLLLTDIDNHYQKLRKTMETLYYNFEQASKSVTDVAIIFESLENIINKFNFQNGENKDLRVYEGIKQVCTKMRQTISNQYNIFKTKIQNLFRYERQNMTTLKEVNEIRSKMYFQYIRQGISSKKQQSKNLKEIEVDSNIPIDEPVKTNKNILKVQNMLWGHYTIENVVSYWKELRFKISQQLTLIAYDELDAQNENLNFWNTVIKKCVI